MNRITTTVLTIGLLTAASPLLDAAEAKTRLRQHYGGVTAQGTPFVLELARGSKAVDSATYMVKGTCDNSPGIAYFATLDFEAAVPAFVPPREHVITPRGLSRSGKFRATGLGTELFGTVTAAMREDISGTLRRNGTAEGAYEADMTLIDENGAAVDRCHTGKVRWTARSRRGRTYAGSTSQAMPVVLELNSQRNVVETLRFGWGAPCTPEGSMMLPDELSDFRLTGRDFGEAFQQPFDLDGGGKRTFDYDVRGRVASRTSATGSMTVKVNETDPAGTVTSACDAGTVTWKARSG